MLIARSSTSVSPSTIAARMTWYPEMKCSPRRGEADGPASCLRKRVGKDLAGGYRWYEEQSAGLGEEFLAAVDASFDEIEQFPEMFAYVRGKVRRAIINRFPYAVFYHVEPKQIVVLAVLHTARDPRLWPQPRK